MEDRVKTGIKGLDELIGEAYEKIINITVWERNRKDHIFPAFIYSALKILVKPASMWTFEEKPEELRREASQFGWTLNEAKKR